LAAGAGSARARGCTPRQAGRGRGRQAGRGIASTRLPSGRGASSACTVGGPTAPPPRRTKWTRRVPPPVLIGHAASLNPYPQDMKRQNGALFRSGGRLARWRTRVHRGMTSRQKKRGKSGASPGPEPMYGLQRGASGADLNCRATVLRNALPRGRLLAGIVVLLEFRAELCSILQAKLLCADTWGSQTM